MNISYKGASVMLRDELRLYWYLAERSEIPLEGYESVAVVGTVVRVIKAPEGSGLPPQLLVFWEGADFVPDTTTWEMPMWLEPATVDGFPVLSVDTDGYGYLYARGADGQSVGCVELTSGEPLQDFLDVVAEWWNDQFAAQQ